MELLWILDAETGKKIFYNPLQIVAIQEINEERIVVRFSNSEKLTINKNNLEEILSILKEVK